MSFNPKQFRWMIREVLEYCNLWSKDAEELLMLTAATESNLGTYLYQVNGPALGVFQMEPTTATDIRMNFLRYKPWLYEKIKPFDGDMLYNLATQIVFARLHYLRVPAPLPPADDILAMAKYYKKYYNTELGKATVDQAIEKYMRYVKNG